MTISKELYLIAALLYDYTMLFFDDNNLNVSLSKTDQYLRIQIGRSKLKYVHKKTGEKHISKGCSSNVPRRLKVN